MSDALAVLGNKNDLPAHLEQARHESTAWDGIGSQTVPRLALVENRIKAMIGGTELASSKEPISVVLVKPGPIGRTYYDSVYEDGSKERPTCYSNDGLTPEEDSINQQCDRCDRCPQNVAGSSKTKKEARACRFRQPVAVWLPGDKTDDTLFRMVLPATSIFPEEVSEEGHRPLNKYVLELRAAGASPDMVFTQIGIMQGKTNVLGFKPLGWITDPKEYAKIVKLRDSELCDQLLSITPDATDERASDGTLGDRPSYVDDDGVDNREPVCVKQSDDDDSLPTAWPESVAESDLEDERTTYWFHDESDCYFAVPAGSVLPEGCEEIDDRVTFITRIAEQEEAIAEAARQEAKRKAAEEAQLEAERVAAELAAEEEKKAAAQRKTRTVRTKAVPETKDEPVKTRTRRAETPADDGAAPKSVRRRSVRSQGTTPPVRRAVEKVNSDPEAARKQVPQDDLDALADDILSQENDD